MHRQVVQRQNQHQGGGAIRRVVIHHQADQVIAGNGWLGMQGVEQLMGLDRSRSTGGHRRGIGMAFAVLGPRCRVVTGSESVVRPPGQAVVQNQRRLAARAFWLHAGGRVRWVVG